MPDPCAVSSGGGRPIRVLLYTLIPAARAFEPIRRAPLVFLRNRLRRLLEFMAWRATGVWRAHYSTFEDRANSNRGDMAIRMGARRQLERAFAGQEIVVDEVAWGNLGAAIDAAPAPYDLIVIAGGGYLFADPDGRLPPRFAADVEALERTTAPVTAVSIGLNHLIMPGETAPAAVFHADQNDLIRRFLDRVDLLSLRDHATREALAAVDPACGQVIIDPAFLLMSSFEGRRARPDDGRPLSVGLNLAFHGAHATLINRDLLRETAEALHSFAASTPVRFTYFVHSDSERAIVAALRLWSVPVEVVDGAVDDMLAAYRRQDMHVGQMLHSTIFAMTAGVPALAVAYDTKSRAFFDLFGLDAYCIDATVADRHTLLAAMCRLAADRHKVAATIAARGAALRTEAIGFYRRVAALAKDARTAPQPDVRPTPRRIVSAPAE